MWGPWHWRRWKGWRWALLAGLVAAVFWPRALGGPVALVVLQSDSMAPTFRRGDLVVVRRAAHYAVGQPVLYRGSRLDAIFHRIVGYDAQGRLVLQGDANAYTDPDHPTPEAIVGRYWFAVPRLGGWLWAWRAPLLAASAGLLVWVWFAPVRPRRRHRERRP